MRSDFNIETNTEKDQEAITESRCDNGGSAGEQSDDVISDAEYDELFNKMQVVGNKSEKVGRKRKLATKISSNNRNIVNKKLATIISP